MPSLLTYAAPPLVGAFIGYMTNYVAIRMLFRPLRPWTIFGLRVPLTPGVIPSRRGQLANNIGEMVGEHLLTNTDVQRAINEQGFQQELRQLIQGRVSSFLAKDLGPIETVIPERFRGHFLAGMKIMRWRFLKHLHCHLTSDPVLEKFADKVTTHIDEFLAHPLSEKISKEDQDDLVQFIENSASRLLDSDEVDNWLKEKTSAWLHGLKEEERGLNQLLPEDLTTLILKKIEEVTPEFLEKLAQLLQEPETQQKMAHGLAAAVGNFASSLGPMAALLGNFLNPDTIAEKILGYLQDKGDDIKKFLLDDQVREQTAAFLVEQANAFLTRPVGGLISKIDDSTMDQIAAGLAGQLSTLLKDPVTAQTIADIFRGELTKRQDRPLNEILTEFLGQERLESGRQWVGGELVSVIQTGGVKRMIDKLVTSLLEDKLLKAPIGPLADFLPKAIVEGIDDFLLQQVTDVLGREVPGLVDSLGFKEMVTKKVNGLDLLHLEGLLLSIMQEQFKYINLFGALLGFFIGLANLFLLRLG